MSRFGGSNGGAHRNQVTHLPDDNDIRVMAQGMHQGGGKGSGVIPDIPLPNNAPVIAEKELNPFLNSDNISRLMLIKVVDHGGQGGRLAIARGAGNQDEPSWLEDKLLTNLRLPQFINGWDSEWYAPEGKAQGSSLLQRINTESV
jgi:hypothetical protein